MALMASIFGNAEGCMATANAEQYKVMLEKFLQLDFL
jgi:hypothetical protein